MEALFTALPSVAVEKERQQLLTRRLYLFTIGWITTSLAWGVTLSVESRLAVFPAALLFTFQLGVLIAAIAICHSKGSTARVPLVVLAACVLLGISSTSMFAAVGGYGDMLMFILLTLYLASSPFFAWSGRAALILIVSTLLPWVMALPFLHFILRPAELAAAIALGAVACFITLQWSQRDFRRVLGAAVVADVARAVNEVTGDLIFAVDQEDRLIYVNAALASLVGLPAALLIGQHLERVFVLNEQRRALSLADGDERDIGVWCAKTAQGPKLFEVVTWRRRDDRGNPLGACMVGRQMSDRAEAPAGPENNASVALLREPLRLLKDEEVRRLKKEVAHLRQQVKRQKSHPLAGTDEDPDAQADATEPPRYSFPEHYRRKRKRTPSPSASNKDVIRN
jgi:PAS domain S-box-containing protein